MKESATAAPVAVRYLLKKYVVNPPTTPKKVESPTLPSTFSAAWKQKEIYSEKPPSTPFLSIKR